MFQRRSTCCRVSWVSEAPGELTQDAGLHWLSSSNSSSQGTPASQGRSVYSLLLSGQVGFGHDLPPETAWLLRHAALHYEADGRMISVTAARRNLFCPFANFPEFRILTLHGTSSRFCNRAVVRSILLWIVLGGIAFIEGPCARDSVALDARLRPAFGPRQFKPQTRELRAATTLGLRRSLRLLGHRDAALWG